MAEQHKYILAATGSVACQRCGAEFAYGGRKPRRAADTPFVLRPCDYIIHTCGIQERGPCWLWKWTKSPTGYARVVIIKRGYNVTRLLLGIQDLPVWEHDTIHDCDNPPCVNPAHIRVGTHQENVDDCINKDRISRGSRKRNAKLSEADIPVIRRRYLAGESQYKLGAEYGVAPSTINRVANRKRWAHA